MKENQQKQLYNWIGREIASLRKKRKFSQAELAKLLCISRGSIANIEKGRQQAPLHLLYDIATQLNAKIDVLLPLDNQHLINPLLEIKSQIEKLDDVEMENKTILTQFLDKI